MATLTEPAQAPKSLRARWVKRVLWLSLIPVILITGYYLLYTYFLVWGGSFSPADLVDTESCGAGEHKLLEYKYRDGSGYVNLVDHSGKVLATSKYSQGTDIGPVHWHDGCRAVNVGSDEGRVILEAGK